MKLGFSRMVRAREGRVSGYGQDELCALRGTALAGESPKQDRGGIREVGWVEETLKRLLPPKLSKAMSKAAPAVAAEGSVHQSEHARRPVELLAHKPGSLARICEVGVQERRDMLLGSDGVSFLAGSDGDDLLRRFDLKWYGTKAKPLASPPGAGGFAVNLDMIDYRERADECRRLAKLRAESQHWSAFLEMAETWEHFGKLQEQSRRLKHLVETKMPEAVLRVENAVRDLEQPT